MPGHGLWLLQGVPRPDPSPRLDGLDGERRIAGRATITTHVSNVLRKLDLAGRTQLATADRQRNSKIHLETSERAKGRVARS